MSLIALKKRSQADNDPQDKKLIKSVLDIINPSVNQAENKTDSARQPHKSDPPQDTSKIVLHIDDDEDDRELVEYAIKKIDPSFILHEAISGEDGIAWLNKAKLSGNLPCLIILDLNMPGMGGLNTYNEIKKDNALKNIPTVLFTTSAAFYGTQNKEGLPIYIKPESSKEFIATVRKILTLC
jgi:CheY-like chemotaxis protein